MYQRFGKRLLDVIVAGSALVLLSPLLLGLALLIRLEDGGKPLFRQERIGALGRRFLLLKFRSMPVDTPAIPSAAATSLRTTRIGRFIRRTNMDELPQLINVLRGQMSIIGPRPALPGQTDLLRMRQANGADGCRPGLTGLAQVNAYEGMPVDEKARLDGEYAGRIELGRDLLIFLRTFPYLLRPPPRY